MPRSLVLERKSLFGEILCACLCVAMRTVAVGNAQHRFFGVLGKIRLSKYTDIVAEHGRLRVFRRVARRGGFAGDIRGVDVSRTVASRLEKFRYGRRDVALRRVVRVLSSKSRPNDLSIWLRSGVRVDGDSRKQRVPDDRFAFRQQRVDSRIDKIRNREFSRLGDCDLFVVSVRCVCVVAV